MLHLKRFNENNEQKNPELEMILNILRDEEDIEFSLSELTHYIMLDIYPNNITGDKFFTIVKDVYDRLDNADMLVELTKRLFTPEDVLQRKALVPRYRQAKGIVSQSNLSSSANIAIDEYSNLCDNTYALNNCDPKNIDCILIHLNKDIASYYKGDWYI